MSATKGLTQAQKEIVKACVPILAEHGKTVTSLFYKNMLNSHTELKNVFNNTHQVTGHQAQSLACSVFAYAKYIDNLEVLGEAVERICQKHASIYIRPDQYAIVGGNLLAAFKEILGEAFTPEIHDAWEAAYWQLANIMIEREKVLYAENDGWTDWRDFVLDKKVKESDEITSFYWKPKDGKPLPLYKPGQYISVQTKVPQFEYLQSRQYSLSGVPSTEYYRNSIKRETGQSSGCPYAKTNPGWISNWLHDNLQVGDTIQMSHPQGEFFMDTKKTSPVVLISGGVGITPMLSMLETLNAEKSNRKVCWMHTTRSSTVQAFGKHVNELCKSLPNAHSVVFNLDPKDAEYTHKGKLDLEKVNKEKDLFLGDKTTEYYVCGPEGFMVDVAQKLQSYGVDKSQIKAELFSTGGVPV